MIDTHCHIDSPRFGDEATREAVIATAADAGVTDIVVPGVYPADWLRLEDFCARWNARGRLPRLHACFGIHPQVLPELSDAEIADALARLAALGARGPAIGECGLDGPTSQQPGGALERQIEVLEAHLDVADRLGLPALLHCLRTHDPMLRLLKKRGGVARGALHHSYSGSAEQVPQYLDLNGWFSFAGPVSYANARRPVVAARAVPLERLLLETDAPDQTPEPHRGVRNEPGFLPDVARALAAAKDLDLEDVLRATTANAARLLKIGPPAP